MTKRHKKIRYLLVVTALLALNLAILGKAIAQIQVISMDILPGNLMIAVPVSITLPKVILDASRTIETTMVLNPNINPQTIQVIDTWTGNRFHVNLTLNNLVNENDEILPYSSFGIVTLRANNSGQSVDSGTSNNPPGMNNISSDPAMNYYYDPTNNPVSAFPNSSFVQFPVDTLDPNPNDEGSVSIPITIMERTVDTPSLGVYSIGLGLRGNMLPGQAGGNYSGELTFSVDP